MSVPEAKREKKKTMKEKRKKNRTSAVDCLLQYTPDELLAEGTGCGCDEGLCHKLMRDAMEHGGSGN